MALQNNYQVQIAQERVDIAGRNNTWLATGIAPSIATRGSANVNYSVPNNPLNPIQNFPSRNIPLGGVVEANWVLFNGLQMYVNKDRLELLQAQSEGNATIIVENTVQATILAYYGARLQQERLDVLTKLMRLSSDRYAYEEERRELGVSTTFEALQFRTAYLTDSTNYLLQEIALEQSLNNLKLIMADESKDVYTLTDSIAINTRDFDLLELQQQMSGSNATLRNQFVNASIFKKELQLAKRSQSPTLSLITGINFSRNYFYAQDFPVSFFDPSQGTVETNQTTTNQSYYANFTLNWNVFGGLQVRRNIQNAKVQERIGNLQVDELKLQLNQELSLQYKTYQTRKQLIGISSLNLQSAELSLQLAEERFKVGILNSLDYRNIQLQYLNAALGQLQALFDVKEAEIELLRLTGGIIDEYSE